MGVAHRGAAAAATALVLIALSGPALAQRTAENAVESSDDAFGTNIGLETTGIYSENDTRGFSPLKAGNYRLDGVYFDPVATLSGRLRASTAIRVGFAALDYPFSAPTGIADARMRTARDKRILSGGITLSPYGGHIVELDAQLPLAADHAAVVLGYGAARTEYADGSGSSSWAMVIKPVFRLGGVEISPFLSPGRGHDQLPRPLVSIGGGGIPALPRQRRYLGQDWALGRNRSLTGGMTATAPLATGLSLRAGVFVSEFVRLRNYSEIFATGAPPAPASPPASTPASISAPISARHIFIADPRQVQRSWSGEAQFAYRFGSGQWQHRIIAGFRMRDRQTDSGGSDIRDFGPVTFGDEDPEAEPAFRFSAVNQGRIRQSSIMLGYALRLDHRARLNLGVQKAGYRADFTDARTGQSTRSTDHPWLYNASLLVPVDQRLSLFLATARGLEDSGAAPENAVNRNEQLPATRSRQQEGGLRWKHGRTQLMASAFRITKPYFAFARSRRFDQLGAVRHRGVELSLSSHLGERFSVLAGAVLMQPRVVGAGADVVGDRPAGTPSAYARVDLNYRTGLLGGLTPTATLTWTGRRAAGSCAAPGPGCAQPTLPAHRTVDLGLRERFRIGRFPASFRAIVSNVFDEGAWKVVAANVLQMDERRRGQFTLSMDF